MTGDVPSNRLTPPSFCQYALGPCDQIMPATPSKQEIFIAYPSQPAQVSAVIEATIAKMPSARPEINYVPWSDLSITGQIIFCTIGKAMRRASALIADVTTLNFNVMFEIGYAVGLGLPVVPIRDSTYASDRRSFEEIGVLDTLGYIDYVNSDELSQALARHEPSYLAASSPPISRQTPLYLLKGPIATEGTIRLLSALKKSPIRFRVYDPVETPRLSLLEARRQVLASTGVVINLLDPERDKALAHNAQSALVAGLAMASGKAVAMLQEGNTKQPIDYRDVVRPWINANNIPALLRDVLESSIKALQDDDGRDSSADRRNILQNLDLGDVAAENEIRGLRRYFVETGQAAQARQGHARLVIGRKGSGKTAIFYNVREAIGRGNDRVVLDLKPEGHQFVELRDSVLDRLGAGLQEHTMVAFWHYLLLGEIARKILHGDREIANRDPVRHERYKRLQSVYERHDPGDDSDFSQRLLLQVDRLTRQLGNADPKEVGGKLTQALYSGDRNEYDAAIIDYLRTKKFVWMLMDNLDKGWPVGGASIGDILIVRSLLEAARKIQHQLEAHDVEFDYLVFLRSDIYETLRAETPDKGKDTAIRLDWEDPELFKQIVARRLNRHAENGNFLGIWQTVCDPLVEGQGSFEYMLERTLMRPRDLLQFLRGAVDVAINRGHMRVTEADLLYAERRYSEDILLATSFEISDTNSSIEHILFAFEGAPIRMPANEVTDRLAQVAHLSAEEADEALEILVWFGFLGVSGRADQVRYSYDTPGNLNRLLYPVRSGGAELVIHPAFRSTLQVGD